jgi:hypothetical protein
MARGRGGIRTQAQYEALPRSSRAAYDRQLDAVKYARSPAGQLHQGSYRQSFFAVHGRYPSGRDYSLRDQLTGSAWREGVVTTNDRLAREPMAVPTADGIFDSSDLSWRQRSLVGKYWTVLRLEGTMSDRELRAALKPFRGMEVRVFDRELGRVVRKPFETNPDFVRRFASSPEARAERIISSGPRST